VGPAPNGSGTEVEPCESSGCIGDHGCRRSETFFLGYPLDQHHRAPVRNEMTASSPSVRVTVLLITYNHAEYVAESVKSILRQRIDEAFDIVVADDGSTDDTVSILQRCAKANPQVRFTFLDSSANLGITQNYRRAFAACRSEYVAVMEGDDYWTSPYKLARQRDFLDAHWECDSCGVNYFLFDENGCRFCQPIPATSGHAVFAAPDIITENVVGNFSTCMYRQTALTNLPRSVFDTRAYDWAINICVSRRALFGFLYEPMAVWRVHEAGAWSRLSHMDKVRTQLALLPDYDALTDGVFRPEFRALADRLQQAVEQIQNAQVAAPASRTPIESSPWLDLIPPIAVTVAKLVLPPAVLRYVVGQGLLGRGRSGTNPGLSDTGDGPGGQAPICRKHARDL